MKTLVAFYSKTGNTKKIAQELAKILKADVDEIVDLKSRQGIVGWLSGGRDAMKSSLTEIKTTKDPAKYDLVIIGTPIWVWNSTPAAITYVTKYQDQINQMAIFTTSGSSGPEKPVAYLEKIAGKESIASAGWTAADLNSPTVSKQKIKEFVKKISL